MAPSRARRSRPARTTATPRPSAGYGWRGLAGLLIVNLSAKLRELRELPALFRALIVARKGPGARRARLSLMLLAPAAPCSLRVVRIKTTVQRLPCLAVGTSTAAAARLRAQPVYRY